jgi:hypothetical protein
MIFSEGKTEPWAKCELKKTYPNEIEEVINSKLNEKQK